jgi:hypothetical protein
LLADETQRAAVARLERVLYAGAVDAGLPAALREAFARGPQWTSVRSPARSDAGELPPLYPPRD